MKKKSKKNQSTYWLIFELIWRDYFKYISLKHGNKIFMVEGILEKKNIIGKQIEHFSWNGQRGRQLNLL